VQARHYGEYIKKPGIPVQSREQQTWRQNSREGDKGYWRIACGRSREKDRRPAVRQPARRGCVTGAKLKKNGGWKRASCNRSQERGCCAAARYLLNLGRPREKKQVSLIGKRRGDGGTFEKGRPISGMKTARTSCNRTSEHKADRCGGQARKWKKEIGLVCIAAMRRNLR